MVRWLGGVVLQWFGAVQEWQHVTVVNWWPRDTVAEVRFWTLLLVKPI